MLNPSYLIQSRHNVYYFRYPLGNKRLCVSLKTRCPKEALRLSKLLEYHSAELIKNIDWGRMDHADIMAMFRTYYSEVLERGKTKIDKSDPLPKENVARLQESLNEWHEVIAADDGDDIMELMGAEYEDKTYDPVKADLQKVMTHNGLSFAPDSKEYGMMKSAYKHVKRNYIQDLLAYNDSVTNFSLLETASTSVAPSIKAKSGHKLGKVLESYLSEIKPSLTERSFNEQRDCLNYLIDWLGADYPIAKLDAAKAREAKELLRDSPNGRNKNALTKGQPLLEQIAIAQKHGLKLPTATNVNKYLGYFTSLLNWAKSNRYVADNPFAGVRVKSEKKKARRREMFNKDEIGTILDNLGNDKLVKNKSNYWGALIAVYTGARRNEIAGLLPQDVKQDAATGIWYFDIADEEEQGKTTKTDASQRVVPVHSRLLEMGLLEFVEESRSMKGKITHSQRTFLRS